VRLLLIISQYSPAQTPNTLRWEPLVSYFQEQGISVRILTSLHSDSPKEEDRNGVLIYRTGHNTLLDKLHHILGRKNKRSLANSGPLSHNVFSKWVEKLMDVTWRKNYWPDGSQLFLKPGIEKGLELIRSEKISHVISVGLPFTCHWIAKQLKEADPSLHWHMDIEDPFCYSEEFWVNNFSKYKEKNIEAEKATFHLADSISVTNPVARDRYQEFFPFAQTKLSVIPPLFHADNASQSYDLVLDSSRVHLAYFGSFYEGVRSPKMFLEFLKFLQSTNPDINGRMQFHFIGRLDRISAALFDAYPQVKESLIIHGFKSRAETLSAMSQVDILMNFGNTTDYHLPSKVVDYLHVNKPVVNFISTEKDSTKAFLADQTSLLNLLLNKALFQEQKAQFLDFVFKKYESLENDFSKVKQYGAEVIAEQYLKQLP